MGWRPTGICPNRRIFSIRARARRPDVDRAFASSRRTRSSLGGPRSLVAGIARRALPTARPVDDRSRKPTSRDLPQIPASTERGPPRNPLFSPHPLLPRRTTVPRGRDFSGGGALCCIALRCVEARRNASGGGWDCDIGSAQAHKPGLDGARPSTGRRLSRTDPLPPWRATVPRGRDCASRAANGASRRRSFAETHLTRSSAQARPRRSEALHGNWPAARAHRRNHAGTVRRRLGIAMASFHGILTVCISGSPSRG